jgi:hypothetical protein
LADRHVGLRHRRILPLLVGISGLLGMGLLVPARAPSELVALVAAMAVGVGS